MAVGLILCVSACSKKQAKVDASQALQQTFKQAEEPVQQAVSSATASLKSGNVTEAARTLSMVSTNRELTQEQRNAMGTALLQVNQAIASDPKLNTREMYLMRQRMFQAAHGNGH